MTIAPVTNFRDAFLTSHPPLIQVRRHAFLGVEVQNLFYLGEVKMGAVAPLAFSFQYVKEFSIFASTFERISMWGVKLER